MDGTSTKHCACTGDMYLLKPDSPLYGRELDMICPFGTTQCYSIGDVNSGKAIEKDCLIIDEAVGCRRENNTKICVCQGEYCNKGELPRISCYVYNGTDAPKLEICPYKAVECYVARDPVSKTLIEAGCDVSDHGDDEIVRCSTDGCNYPMYCYDPLQEKVQCEVGVTECYTSFVKVGERDARVLAGCYSKNNSISNAHGSVCALDDENNKNCVCSGDLCNFETQYESINCCVSNGTEPAKLIKCPIGTTHCYSVGDLSTDEVVEVGCSIFDEKEECWFQNNSKICVCRGETCNKEMPRIKCFVSNETTPATLKTCPLKTTECFVARDPKAQKLIEAGCDVSDHGSQLVEKCSSDGCNYPMYCYDSSKDAIVQCEVGDVGCYVEFEKRGPHEAKQVSGCSPTINSNVSNPSEAVCSLNDDKKQCICFADMCNYETHYESINCYASNGAEAAKLIKCPIGTTHCYSVGDLSTDEVVEVGCSIFDEKEECWFQNNSKICACHGQDCNREIPRIKCFVSNETTSATLETCPLRTAECFVARDPKTQELIEAGCDVSDHGSQLVEKCSSNGCNYPMYCYNSSKNAIVQCDVNITSCYTDFAKTGLDHTITSAGCAVPGQNEGCSMKNGTKTCICHGDNCNQNFEIKCYIANQTTPATLEICPFEAVGCYVARDEKTGKLIEAGCDVGDEGGHHVEKCFGDGCNHPFHCYDVGRNNVQQCDHHITTCFTTFEKADGVLKTSSGCDFGKFGFPLPSNGSTCLVKDGRKYCGCVGDMCNYDKTVQKISCLTSNSTSAAVMEECPIYTTHCFVKMDAKDGKLIEQGCSVFEEGDSCLAEDGVETCRCVGNECNRLSVPDLDLPFSKLYRYVVYSQD